jgi:hypothetical protein
VIVWLIHNAHALIIRADKRRRQMKRLDHAALHPGDIVLTTGPQPVSKAIRAVTASDISHAMIYVESHSVIDATAEGVQSRNTQRLLFDDHCAIYGLRLNRDLTEGELKSVCVYVRSVVGTQYSIWEAARAPLGGRGASSRKQFCSRLVAQAYATAGINLVRDPNYCTPEDIRRSVLLHDLGQVTVPVDASEEARWRTIMDLPQIMRDATNAILSGARQKDPAVQNFNDLHRYLEAHPEDDDFVHSLYQESGYLDLWHIECEKNPWHYDLRLMRIFAAVGGDVADYCRSTLEEDDGNHRFVVNHAGYVVYAARTGLRTFVALKNLYEILASLHGQRLRVARKWFQANNLIAELPADKSCWLTPNSPEWLDALAVWNPLQAEMSRAVLGLAGQSAVCAICGDDPARDYRLIDEPPAGVRTFRLCDDCARIRSEAGERLTPVYL